MFTGIVQEIGTVRHAGPNASGLRLEIASSRVASDLGIDASVNVAGACLTVVERDTHGFAVDVVAETISRTTLGRAIRQRGSTSSPPRRHRPHWVGTSYRDTSTPRHGWCRAARKAAARRGSASPCQR